MRCLPLQSIYWWTKKIAPMCVFTGTIRDCVTNFACIFPSSPCREDDRGHVPRGPYPRQGQRLSSGGARHGRLPTRTGRPRLPDPPAKKHRDQKSRRQAAGQTGPSQPKPRPRYPAHSRQQSGGPRTQSQQPPRPPGGNIPSQTPNCHPLTYPARRHRRPRRQPLQRVQFLTVPRPRPLHLTLLAAPSTGHHQFPPALAVYARQKSRRRGARTTSFRSRWHAPISKWSFSREKVAIQRQSSAQLVFPLPRPLRSNHTDLLREPRQRLRQRLVHFLVARAVPRRHAGLSGEVGPVFAPPALAGQWRWWWAVFRRWRREKRFGGSVERADPDADKSEPWVVCGDADRSVGQSPLDPADGRGREGREEVGGRGGPV